MDDQLDQLLVTREIQDEIKQKIQDKIDELSKNLFNTINQTIKDNFDDIFRQQSEYMSNYYEFVDWRYFSVIELWVTKLHLEISPHNIFGDVGFYFNRVPQNWGTVHL